MVMTVEKKQEIIKEFGRAAGDTGSPEVQVALLTERVRSLTEHLQTHKKDFDTRRSLLILVNRRAKLLDFLKTINEEAYSAIIEKLGIRK